MGMSEVLRPVEGAGGEAVSDGIWGWSCVMGSSLEKARKLWKVYGCGCSWLPAALLRYQSFESLPLRQSGR